MATLLAATLGGPGACRRSADPAVEEAQARGWTHAGADAARSGSSDETGPEGEPVIAWTREFAPGSASEPVFARLAGRDALLVAANDHVLALDLATGQTVWSHDAGASMNASPLVASGHVWIFTMDGRVLRLHARDGALVQETAHDFTLEASPLLIAQTGGGRVLFEETSLSSGQAGGRVLAADAASGRALWHADVERSAGRPAASDGALVFVACHDGARALRATDGGLAWRHVFAGGPLVRVESPILAGSLVLLAGGSMEPAQLVALDAVSGAPRWQVRAAARLSAPPALAGDELLVPLMDGRVHRHSVADGRAVGTLDPGGRSDARPVVGPSRLFVAAGSAVIAFDRAGQPAWRAELAEFAPGGATGENARIEHLAIMGESLVIVSLDGRIRALREKAP